MGRMGIVEDGKKTQFSSTNQPVVPNRGELVSQGYKKAMELRELAKRGISQELKDRVKDTALLIGIPLEEINLEMALHLTQIKKALETDDTKAYLAIMDRIKGKAVQQVDVTSGGNEINISPLSWVEVSVNADK